MARVYDPSVPSEYDAIIETAAKANNIPPDLFRKQIWVESSFKPDTVSAAQAKGLAQFIPSTGKMYGLETDADFFNPVKSVNAGARYMADLMRTYGDWNTAVVAYNGGTKAARNYQRGDVSKLPVETQNYLKLLASPSPNKSDAMSLNSFKNPARLEATSIFDNLADPVTLSSTTTSIKQPEDSVGLLGGIKHGATGTFVRQRLASTDPFGIGESYVPTDEESLGILEAVDYDKTAYRSIVSGLASKEDIQSRLDIYRENREYTNAIDKSGLFSALTSGLGEAVVDPLSWAGAIATGGLGAVGRITVGGALGNVLSGQLRESVTGIESDILMDAASGAVFAGLIEGAAKVLPKGARFVGDTSRRADIIREAIRSGREPDPAILEGIGGSHGLASRLNNMRDWVEAKMPRVTIGETMFASKSKEIADFGHKLFRRERGTRVQMEDGTTVNMEVGSTRTVNEIVEQGEKDLFKWSNRYNATYDKLMSQGLSEEAIERAIYKRMAGQDSGLDNKLIDDIVSDMHAMLSRRGDELKARGFIDEKFDKYIPLSIDERKTADLIAALGGGKNGLEKAHRLLRDSLIRGADDPNTRVRLQKFWERTLTNEEKTAMETDITGKPLEPNKLPDFNAWLRKKANDDAFGYIDQNRSQRNLFRDREGSMSYDHERTPWRTDFEVDSPVGKVSVDSLRRNLHDTVSSYMRRTQGDIAFDEIGLRGWDGVMEHVSKLANDYKLEQGPGRAANDMDTALRQAVKLMYGMSPLDDPRGLNASHAVAEVLRNLAFCTKNAYMGLMNHTEVAEGIKAYGGSFLIRSVPGASKLLGNWTKGGMKEADVRAIQNMVFGDEVRQLNLWRDISRRNIQRYNGNKFLASIVSGSEWAANASPFTRYLQATQKSIVGEAQGQFLAEMARSAHGLAKTKKGFFNKVDLNRNSISPERAKAMLKAVKEATTIDADGAIRITNSDALFSDAAALADIRRMGDYVASNVIQRDSVADAFLWAGKNNPLLNMVMQFKTFAVRSYNKRLAKTMNRVEDEGGLSQLNTMMISGALATIGHIGITCLRTVGMNDEDRTKYLQRNLGIDSLDDLDSGEALMVAAYNGGLLRNGILAAPVLGLNLIGLANPSGKTTVSTDYGNDRDTTAMFKVGDWVQNLFPAFGTGQSVIQFGQSVFDKLRDGMGTTDFNLRDQETIQKNFLRSLKGVTPNWPGIQNYFIEMLKE